MHAIIWHKGMPCTRVLAGHTLRVWENTNKTQREQVMFPRYIVTPVNGDDADPVPCSWVADDGLDVDLEALADKAERNANRAARRAKTQCRWKIKEAGLNELLTLTYRENQCDLDEVHRQFKAWLRIMHRTIPGFRCVYGLERQKRGAWHVHVACDKLPVLLQYRGAKVKAWKVGTAVWRSVVGVNNGLCFVGGRHGRIARKQSTAALAAYVAKYLTKENSAGEFNRNMWGSTANMAPPKAVRIDLPLMCIGDAIALAFELRFGERVHRHQLMLDRDIWLLYTERQAASIGIN